MKKTFRIKKEQEFQQIIQLKQSFANRNFVLYVSSQEQQEHFRVGLSVGKKVGNAVTRNRVKRQMRQALTELKPEIKSDKNIILIARPAVTTLTTAEVKRNIKHVLGLGNVIEKPQREESKS